MGVYCVGWSGDGNSSAIMASEENIEFGARLVAKRTIAGSYMGSATVRDFTADRLQSKGNGSNYYPYGESRGRALMIRSSLRLI